MSRTSKLVASPCHHQKEKLQSGFVQLGKKKGSHKAKPQKSGKSQSGRLSRGNSNAAPPKASTSRKSREFSLKSSPKPDFSNQFEARYQAAVVEAYKILPGSDIPGHPAYEAVCAEMRRIELKEPHLLSLAEYPIFVAKIVKCEMQTIRINREIWALNLRVVRNSVQPDDRAQMTIPTLKRIADLIFSDGFEEPRMGVRIVRDWRSKIASEKTVKRNFLGI